MPSIMLQEKKQRKLPEIDEIEEDHRKYNKLYLVNNLDYNISTIAVRQTFTRPRDELKDEKKARKQAVKVERQTRRADKKATKEQFSKEFKQQTKGIVNKEARVRKL